MPVEKNMHRTRHLFFFNHDWLFENDLTKLFTTIKSWKVLIMGVIFMCGLFNLGFALFHTEFWRIFQWNSELRTLSFANRAIMQILNIQIIYYFVSTAFICFAFSEELMSTKLGNVFLITSSLFWFIRATQQFIFLRANHYAIHILTILFLTGAILFALPIFIK